MLSFEEYSGVVIDLRPKTVRSILFYIIGIAAILFVVVLEFC